MLEALIIGASGYTGAEIARYLHRHPYINTAGLVVSEESQDKNKLLSDVDLHPSLKGLVDLPLIGTSNYSSLGSQVDIVFLATDHLVSHDVAPVFLKQGCVVCDLSAAFRLDQPDLYPQYYGFHHTHPDLLVNAAYGLAEWHDEIIKTADLIAVPGCYPTAAQLALKPLIEKGLLDCQYTPIIYAISGVSGAGRKSHLSSSFCEVSVQAYALFEHRHQPEISLHLGQDVIFIPHLGKFKRGIYQTIVCRIKKAVTEKEIRAAFDYYYQHKPLVRMYDKGLPALKSVVGSPYCDIGFVLKDNQLIVIAAEDNLLKGAAAQAVQCVNLRFGFDETLSLL